MVNKQLEVLSEKLLDMSKRNMLINFRECKTGLFVEIVAPDSNTLFDKFQNGDGSRKFEVFDPMLDEFDDVDAEEIPVVRGDVIDAGEEIVDSEKDENDPGFGLSDPRVLFIDDDDASQANEDESEKARLLEEQEKRRKRDEYIDKYSKRLKKSNILIYNPWVNPIRALKKLDKKAREFVDESGVNVAYIAFGFVHWKESGNSRYEYAAPLLLAPISFSKETALSPYYLHMTDDDIIVNPTFSQKLKTEYGFVLPPLEDRSLEDYLACVGEQLDKLKLDWYVTSESKIGLFSFQKLNMYEDIKANEEEILKNANICAILNEKIEKGYSDEKEVENPVKNPLIDIHNVFDADCSQLQAIQCVKEGKSFVLQGPPGTGKSQTIANIIAECLYDGKKVLFVSEKQAALNVVYDRLSKAGLAEFCLELHSHKANKKDFINELDKTLGLNKAGVAKTAQEEIEQKIKAQNTLDEYVNELHVERPVIEFSLYELYERSSKYRKASDVDYLISNIESLGQGHLREALDLLNEYVKHTEYVGPDYRNNPWYGNTVSDTSLVSKNKIKADLEDAVKILISLEKCVKVYSEKYGIDIDSITKAFAWRRVLFSLFESELLTPYFIQEKYHKALGENIKKLHDMAVKYDLITEQIKNDYDRELFDLPVDEYYKKLKRQFQSHMSRLGGEYKKIISDIQLVNKDGKKLKYEEAVDLMKAVSDAKEIKNEFDALSEKMKPVFGPGYRGMESDWDAFVCDTEFFGSLIDDGFDFGKIALIPSSNYQSFRPALGKAAQALNLILDGHDNITDILSGYFDKTVVCFGQISVSELRIRLESCLKDIDILDNYESLLRVITGMERCGVNGFVDKALEQNIEVKHLPDSYAKLFYNSWIDCIVHKMSTVMKEANRISHDEAVRLFKEKDKKQLDINKAVIRAALSSKRPAADMPTEGSSVYVLKRETTKKRKQKGIRLLLEEIGDLVQTIKPCFLMSPLSVSTYLNSSSIRFDVVIFDEASQIFPWDAIGSIYRGKQLVVAGDSKQMPPTNFFSSTGETEVDEEDRGDATDYESLLDICSSSMPQIYLSWHYRSKYEQLISYSNKYFYDSNLITFPSVKDETEERWVGVSYENVDGIYERGKKINRKEAERVVDLVYENLRRYPDRSLGVVTINISQQDYIERLLNNRRVQDPSLEEFFNLERSEPFFIKNIETVQGDERDTIIFDTLYGKDAQGAFRNVFGAINRDGGERRINVAVTRAKKSMQVISSMHGTDISITENAGKGRRMFREYLEFAEKGQVALDSELTVNQQDEFDSDFEMEVCDFLRENGYSVDTQVGCCRYKIDLGLKRANSSDYILAIECDGATYHSSKNARDRDRLRQEILESMGWKFYRIWSTDWFKNNRLEKQKLLEAVENALHGNVGDIQSEDINTTAVNSDNSVNPYEETIEVKEQHFAKYISVDVEEMIAKGLEKKEIIEKIIQVESPISKEWMLKRLLPLYDAKRISEKARRAFDDDLRSLDSSVYLEENGFLFYQPKGKKSPFRVPSKKEERRDLEYIYINELMQGIMVLINKNVTVERHGLYSSILKEQGYSKLSERSRGCLDVCVSILEKSNLVEVNGEYINLKKKP